MRMLNRLKARRQRLDNAGRLYGDLVAHARRADFYLAFGVPDTMLGRFEMICLHAFVVFRRLGAAGDDGRAMAQQVHDLMFADLDRTLREQGIGDMGIGKRVKKLARNLYGRIAAYEHGLADGPAEMGAALRRNLYATASASEQQIAAMVGYIDALIEYLDRQATTDLLDGKISFPAPRLPADLRVTEAG